MRDAVSPVRNSAFPSLPHSRAVEWLAPSTGDDRLPSLFSDAVRQSGATVAERASAYMQSGSVALAQ
jgi:hypothetical protein